MPIRITGLNSGLDTDSIVQELVSAHRTKQQKYEKAQTKLSWKQDAWKEMNTKIYGFYSKTLSNMRWEGNFVSKKKTTVSDTTKALVTADGNVVNGTQTLKVNKLATAGYLTGTELKSNDGEKLTGSSTLGSLGVQGGTLELKVGNEVKQVQVRSDMKISEFVSTLKEAGVTASFDESNQRFFINSSQSGEANDINFVANDSSSLDTLSKLGLATEQNYNEAGVAKPADKVLAVKQKAENAEIELNGTVFKSDSNKFVINGLTIQATGVSDLMTISTETDVDGIYDMIKNFIKEYSTLVNSMEAAYNADSAKGYEPLTDDEKSELSDKEVEKWETKIKDSLLRRDDTLSSVLSSMSMAMGKSYEINGERYSLSSFGIKTTGYFTKAENETYAYHIDGDKDDASTEGNTDKLRKAIAENPEAVTKFFTQLAKDVYGALDEKMKKTELSSSYTVYNDVQMQKEYDEYTKTIKKWEDKLKDLEDYYYNKFAAMETALSQLQSQTNSLTSLLGG